MAQSITFICEACGEMFTGSPDENWIEVSKTAQGAGWMTIKLASGWHHFCRDCANQIAGFIAGLNARRPIPSKSVELDTAVEVHGNNEDPKLAKKRLKQLRKLRREHEREKGGDKGKASREAVKMRKQLDDQLAERLASDE